MDNNNPNFEALSSQMLDAIGEAVIATDLEGNIQYWNRAAENLYMWSSEEAIGKNILEITPSNATREQAKEIMVTLSQGNSWTGEFEVQRKDGTNFLAHVSDAPIHDEKGEFVGIIGVSRDISDRKQIEDKLRQNQERLQLVMEATNNGIYDWHIPTNQVSFNRAYFQMLGYEFDELPHTFDTYLSLIHPEDAKRSEEMLEAYLNGQSDDNAIEMRYKTKSGEWKWLLSRGKVVDRDDDGNPIRFVGTNVDIDELIKSRLELSKVQNAAQVGGWEWNTKSNQIIWADEVIHNILGTDSNTTLNPEIVEGLVHPEDIERVWQSDLDAIKNKTPVEIEYRIVRPDAEVRWVLAKGVFDFNSDGEPENYIGSIQDISERKLVEIFLQESETRFRNLFEQAGDGIVIHDIKGNIVDVNQTICELFEYSKDEFCKLNLADTHPPDSPAAESGIQAFEHLMQNGQVKFETEFLTKSGKIIDGDVTASEVVIEGETLYLAVFRNITARKHAEQALQQNKALLDMTGKMARIGGWELDAETLETRWTEEIYRIHEVPFDYQTDLEEAVNFYHPDDREKISQAVQRALGHGDPYDMEVRFFTANRKPLWVRTSCQPMVENGKTIKLFGLFQDITERKNAEEELKKINSFNQTMLKTSPDVIYVYDLEDRTNVYTNDKIADMAGYSPKEIKDFGEQLIPTLMHPDDLEIYINETIPRYENTKDGEIIENTYRMKHKNGSWLWLNFRETIFERNHDGKPKQILGMMADVTERKKAEEELKESEKRLSEAQELAHIGSWEYTIDPDTVVWSKELFNIFELPSDLSAPKYSEQPPFYTEESFAKLDKVVEECVQHGIPYEIELDIITSSGSIKQIISIGTAKKDSNNKIIGCYGTAQDVTERKQAEDALRKRTAQIERMNEMYVGREGRMIDLKREVNALLEELGQPSRYDTPGQVDELRGGR